LPGREFAVKAVKVEVKLRWPLIEFLRQTTMKRDISRLCTCIVGVLFLLVFGCGTQEISEVGHRLKANLLGDTANPSTVKRKIAGQDCKGEWSRLGEYITPECKSAHRSMPTFQSGMFTVGPSLYTPLKVVTHSFRKSFRFGKFLKASVDRLFCIQWNQEIYVSEFGCNTD
jgi:hypothetical protein